jgi:galactitol-specific phosphotransferase system IIB component
MVVFCGGGIASSLMLKRQMEHFDMLLERSFSLAVP